MLGYIKATHPVGRFINFTTPPAAAAAEFPLVYRCFIRRFNKYTSHAIKDDEISSLKPDLAFEKWLPAPITAHGEYKSISNYNKEKGLFPEKFKDFYKNWLDEELLPCLGRSAFERLPSYDAAVSHIPSDSKKASVGLPGTLAGFTEKEMALNDPVYSAYLKEVYEKPLPVFIFSTCTKNELRPMQKALDHSVRTFCIANLEHMLVSLKYFANFADEIVKACNKRFSCIGFTQYHGEWHKLIQQYLNHECWAKDARKFDFNMFSQYMLWFFEWFGEHAGVNDDLQYQIFVHMTVNKVVVTTQGFVIMAVGSNPSGHYLTAIINTFFNNALNLFAFWKHCQPMADTQIRTLYRRIIIERDLGDDSLEGVLKEYSKFYNVTIQIGILGKILDYTTSSVPGSILEQDFLSLRTTIDPITNRFVPYPFSTRWWSSLDISFKKLDPVSKLEKLCSMRNHAFYNKVAFTQISNIAKLYMEKYRWRIGEKGWDDATRQYISERQIRALYDTKRN